MLIKIGLLVDVYSQNGGEKSKRYKSDRPLQTTHERRSLEHLGISMGSNNITLELATHTLTMAGYLNLIRDVNSMHINK